MTSSFTCDVESCSSRAIGEDGILRYSPISDTKSVLLCKSHANKVQDFVTRLIKNKEDSKK